MPAAQVVLSLPLMWWGVAFLTPPGRSVKRLSRQLLSAAEDPHFEVLATSRDSGRLDQYLRDEYSAWHVSGLAEELYRLINSRPSDARS